MSVEDMWKGSAAAAAWLSQKFHKQMAFKTFFSLNPAVYCKRSDNISTARAFL